MSTSHNDNRPKRPITKPPRYQTTSSDEDIRRKVGKQDKSVTKTLESDMRDLRVILQENFSHDYNKNSQTPLLHTLDKVKQYTQTQAQDQPHTPTQVPCPTISTHNQIQCPLQTSTQTPYQPGQMSHQFPSSQTSINSQSCSTLPQSITPVSQIIPVTICNSPIMLTQNQNVTDNIINTCNKFQANFSNIGRAIQTTTNYSAQRTESEEENRKIQERLSYIETELRKLNNTVERILQCVQTKQDRRRALQKPKCLPISTELEMQTFEMTDEEIYEEVVDYLQYVGGFTTKEAINLSFKEVLKDSLTMAYTWFGREQESQPFYNKRIIMAIYDAVCNNRHFNKPTEFQAYVREALRTAKQRHRISTRVQLNKQQHAKTARDYWKDGNEEGANQLQSNIDSHDEDD